MKIFHITVIVALASLLFTIVFPVNSQGDDLYVGSVMWSPSGDHYAVGIFGNGTKILTKESVEVAFIDVWGTVRWSPDGSKIAVTYGAVAPQVTATDVNNIREYLGVWETTNFTQISEIEVSTTSNFDWGNNSVIALDGKLAQTQADGEIVWLSTGDLVIIDSSTGILQREIDLPNQSIISDIRYDPTGNTIAVASNYANNNAVLLYDSASGTLLNSIEDSNSIVNIEWAPNGNQIAYGVRNKGIVVWDVISNSLVVTLPTESMNFTALSWESSFLATDDLVSSDRLLIRIWETTNWQEINVQQVTHTVYDISLSPDGTLLLYGTSDNMFEIIQTIDCRH
jgi:WD40 repeat protein